MMNRKVRSRIMGVMVGVIAVLAFSPLPAFAQTTTFSGRAVALRLSAAGVALALSDTGPLPSTGGNLKTSLASVDVAGLVTVEALGAATSGSGSSSQSQAAVVNVNVLGGLVAADVVKANSKATCSGGQAAPSGSSEIVGLVVAGLPVLNLAPNVAISVPGGLSLIVNEQISSSGGNTGSMTVNALHITGPTIDIVISSAQSGITCS